MPVEIRCFPSDDASFRAAVARALMGLTEVRSEADLMQSARRLLAPLRADYPVLAIRVPASLARVDNRLVLYVFRDGRL